MKDYEFELTFSLSSKNDNPANYVEALGAGCDDAIVGIGQIGRIALGFTKIAESYASAVDSAISDVLSAIPGAVLLDVNALSMGAMYLIYDLECSFSDSDDAPLDFRELLELGMVVVDKDYMVVDTFQSYVKPVFHPVLPPECLMLLGDIQSHVDEAEELPVVWSRFEEWLLRFPVGKVASWGISDQTFLKTQLERYQLDTSFIDIPYTDLKKAFRLSRPIKIKPVGLKKASQILEIEMAGRHHSALDDAMSALNVTKHLNLLGDSL